ncbi:MAG TPA: hypothetical protein VIK60_17920 [Vicinamibacterales bacterium]
MTTARSGFLLTTIAWLAFASGAAARDETIDRVKDLYRSAAYEEALAVLDQMAKDPASARPNEASEYRLLCLIALERRTEARDAIASMVTADPFYQLSQVSPRVRTMFKDVRQSLLPTIVQRAYTDAKAAFDRQDPQSSTQFERVLTLLNDPDIAGAPTSADLRTVASAFRDLSKALEQRPEPAPAVTPPVAPDNNSERSAAPVLPIVYRDGEPDLVAPEALNQVLPRWVLPSALAGRPQREWQGILEVVIDENGDVIAATLRKSFHSSYDAQLVRAAMSWKYRPARKSGTPVRFLKIVSVRLDEAN